MAVNNNSSYVGSANDPATSCGVFSAGSSRSRANSCPNIAVSHLPFKQLQDALFGSAAPSDSPKGSAATPMTLMQQGSTGNGSNNNNNNAATTGNSSNSSSSAAAMTMQGSSKSTTCLPYYQVPLKPMYMMGHHRGSLGSAEMMAAACAANQSISASAAATVSPDLMMMMNPVNFLPCLTAPASQASPPSAAAALAAQHHHPFTPTYYACLNNFGQLGLDPIIEDAASGLQSPKAGDVSLPISPQSSAYDEIPQIDLDYFVQSSMQPRCAILGINGGGNNNNSHANGNNSATSAGDSWTPSNFGPLFYPTQTFEHDAVSASCFEYFGEDIVNSSILSLSSPSSSAAAMMSPSAHASNESGYRAATSMAFSPMHLNDNSNDNSGASPSRRSSHCYIGDYAA